MTDEVKIQLQAATVNIDNSYFPTIKKEFHSSRMPTYVSDYTETDDEEVMEVPYVKPPPIMITLSASEDEQEIQDEIQTPKTNVTPSNSKKGTRSHAKNTANETREQNVLNESSDTMSRSGGRKRKGVKKSQRPRGRDDVQLADLLVPDAVLPMQSNSRNYSISVLPEGRGRGNTKELSQNVEPGVDLKSNAPYSIGTQARNSEIVTDSGSITSSHLTGSNKEPVGKASDDFVPLIQISSAIFETDPTPLAYSPANMDNSVMEVGTKPNGKGKKRLRSSNTPVKTPRKRPSTKSAQEQSRSDLLKFIQHLGLPLQELPPVDTETPPSRKGAPRKLKAISQSSSAGAQNISDVSTTKRAFGSVESQAFVSKTLETNQLESVRLVDRTKQSPRKSGPARKKVKTSDKVIPTADEIILTLGDLESIRSDIQMNVILPEERSSITAVETTSKSANSPSKKLTHKDSKLQRTNANKTVPKRNMKGSLVLAEKIHSSVARHKTTVKTPDRKESSKLSKQKSIQDQIRIGRRKDKEQENVNEIIKSVAAGSISKSTEREKSSDSQNERKEPSGKSGRVRIAHTPKNKTLPNKRTNVYDADDIFPKKWSSKLRTFYGKIKDSELEISDIRSSQSGSTKKWQATEDRSSKYQRTSRIRCDRCSHFGHSKYRCTEKLKPTVCSMCGSEGHSWDTKDKTCPNSLCLNCGASLQNRFQSACERCLYRVKPVFCNICEVSGHVDSLCPDHWRRYHSTNDVSMVVTQKDMDAVRVEISNLERKSQALIAKVKQATLNTQKEKHKPVGSDGYKRKLELVEQAETKELSLIQQKNKMLQQWQKRVKSFDQLKAKLAANDTRIDVQKNHPPPKSVYKAAFKVFCANCGTKGHNYFHCTQVSYKSTYSAHKPFVIQELSLPKRPIQVSATTPTSTTKDTLSSRKVTLEKEFLGSVEKLEIQIENPHHETSNHNEIYENSLSLDINNETSTSISAGEIEIKVKLTLNPAEYVHLERAIKENKANDIFGKNNGRNVNVEILKDKCEVLLCGIEERVDLVRLDIFKLLFDLKATELANKGLKRIVESKDVEPKSDAPTTSSFVNKYPPEIGITNRLMVNENETENSKLRDIEQLKEFEYANQPQPSLALSVNVGEFEAFQNLTNEIHLIGNAKGHTTIRNEASSSCFQVDELPNMFDIQERIVTGNNKFLTTMFQPTNHLSVAPLREYIPIPVPAPVPIAEYAGFMSSDSAEGFGPLKCQTFSEIEATSRTYYQSSREDPQLPQVLPTVFESPRFINTITPGPKFLLNPLHASTMSTRAESPEIEIIEEINSKAGSTDAESMERKELNNVKDNDTLIITLLNSEWQLFCDDKTHLLKTISKALNVYISLSKTDMMITIKGRCKEDRRLAQKNILNFLQAKAANLPFTLSLSWAALLHDRETDSTANPERDHDSRSRDSGNSWQLRNSGNRNDRYDHYHYTNRPNYNDTWNNQGSFPNNNSNSYHDREYHEYNSSYPSNRGEGNRYNGRGYNPYYGSNRSRGSNNYNRSQRYFN